jgi:hypothetical protein
MRNAPAGSGALAVRLGGDTGTARLNASRSSSQAKQRLLVFRYRVARARLNARLDLLEQALQLRERLTFGFDLDEMVEEVRAFRRHCWRVTR